ncbi:hypothetical protein V1502_04165 [Bacillus sp. SCS-153A]|uniref:hypothetical protein n=1 Tax=Rossellomorea sedimentorum TaxID=3115294 RepID=UPI0039069867
MSPLKLPILLGGPIIRRADTRQVTIWLATSEYFDIKCVLYTIHTSKDADNFDYKNFECSFKTNTIQAGTKLFIHLVTITPVTETFPVQTLIGYNVFFDNGSAHYDLSSFDLLTPENPAAIIYGNLLYPTFFLCDGNSSILYGSCRKLHGKGPDVLSEADEVLSSSFHTDKRPSALFLMGDQIYADDVADPVFPFVLSLSKELIGQREDLAAVDSRLNSPPFKEGIQKINGRQFITEHFCNFTSNNADNHLLSFGEYAAMYLLSWNPALWHLAHRENLFLSFEEALKMDKIYFSFHNRERFQKEYKAEVRLLKKRYVEQCEELFALEEALCSVRRLMANIPTYMIFDDHDITDDWNLTETWKSDVRQSPLGRHVISNALASYWLFQGWGNDPDSYEHFHQPLQSYFGTMTANSPSHLVWMDTLWEYSSWHFITPTIPAAVFLDTRTQRDYIEIPQPVKIGTNIEELKLTPNLIDKEAWDAISKKLRNSAWEKGAPLIIVSPPPLYGIGLIENFIQKFSLPLRTIGIPVQKAFDMEAWKYNEKGFSEFLCRIADWSPEECIILSGDVHSASAVKSNVILPDGRNFSLHQFTSSPIKNMSYSTIAGTLMKFLIMLNARKRTNRRIHRYCSKQFNLLISEMESSIPQEYEWKETIQYLKIKKSSLFETENNIGLFTYTPHLLTNTLLLKDSSHHLTLNS